MRRFHSYGPVNEKHHFTVDRQDLVETGVAHLVGDPEEGGHYFTIWAPRQTGKTWLMRQVKKEIETRHGDRFILGCMSMQGVILAETDPEETFLTQVPQLIWEAFDAELAGPPKTWEAYKNLFSRKKDLFDRPVILFIDEFDSLPSGVIDRLVTLFRDMYLKRNHYLLHGLALIGVRAVLGVGSDRGSPFNVQRSMQVPNFTREEVTDLFSQYREESGQTVAPEVVARLYEATQGQPGLVCWFGELLTEKYNPGQKGAIGLDVWDDVYRKACTVEWNNTVLNLVKKARGPYRSHIVDLFARTDVPFRLDADWCAYAYLNGIIDHETQTLASGGTAEVCRFSSPFVQTRVYNALMTDLVGDGMPALPLDPLDDLADVFSGTELDLAALLGRYKEYLGRLKTKGLNPWKEQPRRADLHLSEAVGHFHLYAWLREAVAAQCVVSPEFPAGNGKVDLHLQCGDRRGIIEVKSFKSFAATEAAKVQAARYAGQMGLASVALAIFVPVSDEKVLDTLSGETVIDEVTVTVAAIGWT